MKLRSTLDQARQRATAIRLAVFDVDGVLTDGRLQYGPEGETVKTFNVRDGHGIRLLQQAGIECALLSGRSSPAVAARARDLGIAEALQGVAEKGPRLARLLAARGLAADQCAFMGDDWPDLPVLLSVGFAATVADADAEVQAAAHWISPAGGGQGAVRQFAEFVLQAQGRLAALAQAARQSAGVTLDRGTAAGPDPEGHHA